MLRGGEAPQVWYAVSRTINTGNYESVRVECGGSMPVPAGEDGDEVFGELQEEVESRLNDKVDEVLTQLGVKKKTSKRR